MYSLAIPEARSLKSSHRAKLKGVSKTAFLSGGAKGKSVSCPFFFFPNLFGSAGSYRGARSSIFVAACRALVVACKLSCGMWNLVPRPGIKPGPPALELEVLATGPLGSPRSFLPFLTRSCSHSLAPGPMYASRLKAN